MARVKHPTSLGSRYNDGRPLMPRPSRSAVGLCIAVIALAAFLPGISSLEYALLEPHWILLPDDTPIGVCNTIVPRDEQLVSFLFLLRSRAPPSLPVV